MANVLTTSFTIRLWRFDKKTAPVQLLDAVLEKLDYKELQYLYSPKGRKSKVPPHILFKIFVYIMPNGM